MKKLFIVVSLFAFFISVLSSCKASSRCQAYSKVDKVQTGKSI